MPADRSISTRGKGPIRAEAEPDVTANHAPIQISRGAGVTLVVASLLGLAFVGWKAPSVLTTTVGGFALALAFSFPREPLLLVGLIAGVRRTLLLTAGLEEAESMEEFQNMVVELGVMTSLVIVLTIALYFTRRLRPPDAGSPLSENELSRKVAK